MIKPIAIAISLCLGLSAVPVLAGKDKMELTKEQKQAYRKACKSEIDTSAMDEDAAKQAIQRCMKKKAKAAA